METDNKAAIAGSDNEHVTAGSKSSVLVEETLLKCEECGYSTHNKHYLKQHVDLVHHAARPYKCPFCDYAGKRNHSLKEHLLIHSTEKPYECSFCNATFRKKGHLTNHIKMHSTQRVFECNLCRKQFMDRSVLYTHLRSDHEQSAVFTCDCCEYASTIKSNIIMHMNTHTSNTSYNCNVCEYVTSQPSLLAQHLKSHDPLSTNHSAKSPTILLKCSECGYTTENKDELKNHMFEEHLDKINAAEKGNETRQAAKEEESPKISATEKSQLTATYKCTECSFTSTDATVFITHMLTHQPRYPPGSRTGSTDSYAKPAGEANKNASFTHDAVHGVYRCTICNYSCDHQRTIKAHIWKHSGHKGIEYPMFQNGPLSIYDEIAPVNVHPETNQPTEQKSSGVVNTPPPDMKIVKILDKKGSELGVIWQPKEKSGKVSTGGKSVNQSDMQTAAPNLVNLLKMSSFDRSRLARDSNGSNYVVTKAVPVKQDVLPKRNETKFIENSQRQSEAKANKLVVSGCMVSSSTTLTSPTITTNLRRILEGRISLKVVDSDSKEADITHATKERHESNRETVAEDEESVNDMATMSAETKNPDTKESKNTQPKDTENVLEALTADKSQNASQAANKKQSNHTQSKIPPKASQPPIMVTGKRKMAEGCEDELYGIAKKLCSEGKIKGGKVVVETLSEEYNFNQLKFQDNRSSPRTVEHGPPKEGSTSNSPRTVEHGPHKEGSTSNSPRTVDQGPPKGGSSGPKTVVQTSSKESTFSCQLTAVKQRPTMTYSPVSSASTEDSNMDTEHETKGLIENEMQQSNSVPDRCQSAPEGSVSTVVSQPTEEQAVTLLSLLKKGPNYNPACPINVDKIQKLKLDNVPKKPQEDHMTQTEEANQDEGNNSVQSSETTKPKSGICSSLLAVIEQLRERSKSESETDDGTEGSQSTKSQHAGSKARSRSRRSRKNATEVSEELDGVDNVEKVGNGTQCTHRCRLCHYTSPSTSLMKQHMRLHKDKQPFECSLCNHVAVSSEALQDHMIQHCKVRTYQCKLCASVFNYKSQLRAHMRAHNEQEQGPFLCEVCSYETNSTLTFKTHMQKHKAKATHCVKCDQDFKTAEELRQHQKEFCKVLSTLQCEECNYTPSDPEDLLKHTEDQHSKEPRCEQCRMSWRGLCTICRAVKEEKEALKCQFCDFVAGSIRSLKSHMKRHVNDQRYVLQPLEQYKCNLCGYVCHHLPSLKSHMWRHASDTNYSYQSTNDIINAAIDFDSNIEQMSGNPEVDSTEEGSTSDNQDSTISDESGGKPKSEGNPHLQIKEHRDKKFDYCLVTFRCCQCGFESINKATLNTHMKIHTDIIRKTLEVYKSSDEEPDQKKMNLDEEVDTEVDTDAN